MEYADSQEHFTTVVLIWERGGGGVGGQTKRIMGNKIR